MLKRLICWTPIVPLVIFNIELWGLVTRLHRMFCRLCGGYRDMVIEGVCQRRDARAILRWKRGHDRQPKKLRKSTYVWEGHVQQQHME